MTISCVGIRIITKHSDAYSGFMSGIVRRYQKLLAKLKENQSAVLYSIKNCNALSKTIFILDRYITSNDTV